MDAMTPPAGTYEGHVLPGLILLAWGVAWLIKNIRAGGSRSADQPLESGLLIPWMKILTLLVAGWIEMPNAGWYPADYVMGWHHITMYMGFTLAGVVDLLHRRGRMSARATYVAFALASFNVGLLFYGHGNHGGVESTAHLLVAAMFGACAVITAAEAVWPGRGLHWFRIGALLTTGAWLAVIGWLLFGSGWDLADPVRVGWVFPIFSWVGLGVAALLVAVSAYLSTPSRDVPPS